MAPEGLLPLNSKAAGTSPCIKQPAGDPNPSAPAVSSGYCFSKNTVNPLSCKFHPTLPPRVSETLQRGKPTARLLSAALPAVARGPAGWSPNCDAQVSLQLHAHVPSPLSSNSTGPWPPPSVTSTEGLIGRSLTPPSPGGGSLSRNPGET